MERFKLFTSKIVNSFPKVVCGNDRDTVIIILFDYKSVIFCNIVMYLLFLQDIILILNSVYSIYF